MALKLGTLMSNPRNQFKPTAQISQIIANVASSDYGGCSADRIDELLAPLRNVIMKNIYDAQEWIGEKNAKKHSSEENEKRYF